MKPKVLVVLGPTASGKSSLGLSLAKAFDGEIISADSMQIYRYMNIGTAKPTDAERKDVPHYMVDIVDPTESYTLAVFCEQVKKCLDDVLSRGKVPVLVGGTGLYLSTLIDNITLTESEHDESYRLYLNQLAEREGGSALKKMLMQIDPQQAELLHDNDIKRLSRALEIFHETGLTKTEQDAKSRRNESPYDFYQIGLTYEDREALYDRINRRVDVMFDMGLEEEVETLVRKGLLKVDTTAGQAIGYKEFFPYFDGRCTLDEVRDTIKQESRRYAKRQLTWFRRDKRIHWTVLEKELTQDDEQKIIREVACFLER